MSQCHSVTGGGGSVKSVKKSDKVMGRASHLRVEFAICGYSRPPQKSQNHEITQSQGVGVVW